MIVEWIPWQEKWVKNGNNLLITQDWVYLATDAEKREHSITWKNVPLRREVLLPFVFPRLPNTQ